MNAKETAVVFIEFQNEFCKQGGKMFDGVKAELARQNTIANAVKLANGARTKGVLVVHSPFIFSPEYFQKNQMRGIVQMTAEGGAFREDTWGGSLIDEMSPKPGDELVRGKCTLCGFNNSNLEKILKAHNIKNVIVAGFLTNVCVESTARTAYDKGYCVTVVKDATCALSSEEQIFTENKIFPLLGGSLTVDEVLAQVK